MIDHLIVPVSNLEASKRFYARALEPLGYQLAVDYDEGAGIAVGGEKPDVWLVKGEPFPWLHFAYRAGRAGVDAFYEAALAAGGTDNGPPGIRARYHEHYYAAYVLDPDGYNVEAVCQEAE